MTKLKPAVGPLDHLRGSLSAPITLVEFGDYQCPFCGQAYPIVRAVEEALGDRLCFAFRNFPIVAAHPHALAAAEAAEAAGAQDRFWEMHDLLYTHRHGLDSRSLLAHAASLDLDLERFALDLREHRFEEKIRADLHSAAISGVNGTPTFFINGQRHDGGYDFDGLMNAISDFSGVEDFGTLPGR